MDKYLKILEFNKIIQLIENFARHSFTKQKLTHIELSNDTDVVEKKLEEVDEATKLIQRMGLYPFYFSIDLNQVLERLHKGAIINPSELVEIGHFLDTIKDNYLYWEKCDSAGITAPYYIKRIESLSYIKELNNRIKQIINNYGEIQDEASPNLKLIRKQMRDLEKKIEQKLQEILSKEKDKLSQSTISIRNDRYVIPVKNDYKNTIKGIIHDQSASKETVFIEPLAVNSLVNELKILQVKEEEEINRILHEISLFIDNYYEELSFSYEQLIELDIIFSKAQYAISISAKKPQISKNGILNLVNCYHPLLNVPKIIKNTVVIGKSYQGIIITGPNTGGKTVLLKTIGLLCLMVKAGILIPADIQSSVPLYSGIYADIGDEQSISQNLSTFSSHLSNVVTILKLTNEESLVLLDELGSGTDPIEGASLAISIFDYLLAKRCHIVATSHYSELKLHAYRTNSVINASVEFDEETFQPTYRLLLGIPGMSNALKIAEKLGLPNDIINNALAYSFKKNDDINIILNKLIKESQELEAKLNIISKQIEDYNLMNEELAQEKKKLIIAEKEILEKANEKANKLIEKKLSESLELLNELKNRKQDIIKLHEIAEYTRKIRNLDEKILIVNENDESNELYIDDIVFIKKHNVYGKIVKLLPNNFYSVSVGNAMMRLPRNELSKDEKIAIDKPNTKHSSIDLIVKRKASSTLDLRGKRYEEASVLLDKFIDEAVYANLNSINIIHGFGTGTIRKLVSDTLKQSPHIADYRYGGSGEGGQGITIANLKK